MKIHQYLLSTVFAATLMSGAMAATPAAGIASGASAAAAAAVAQSANAAAHPLAHPKHVVRKHKHKREDFFIGLSPDAKVQKIASRAADFYNKHGFTNAVEAYENNQNKFFRPDGPYGNTYVVLFDSSSEPGKIEAHPDGDMRSMIAIDMPAVQEAVKSCAWGKSTSLNFKWQTQHVVGYAVPVDNGRYCVVARTNVA